MLFLSPAYISPCLARHHKNYLHCLSYKKGIRYRFLCDLSGAMVYESKPFKAKLSEQEILLIWENEAKKHYNMCKKCGKFVSDVMYNADVLNCVECSPWENQPHYCLNCGIEVSLADKFCSKCGTKLLYGEVDKL